MDGPGEIIVEDVLRKIAALMAKSDGTENEHEAAVFAAKAQEMLARHNLTMMEVLKRNAAERDEMVGEVEVASEHDASGWRAELMRAVAEFYFCCAMVRPYEDSRSPGLEIMRKFLLIGKPHNVKVAESMFAYLEKTTLRLARDWMLASDGTLQEQRDFECGCGLRLKRRLYEMFDEQHSSKKAVSHAGVTLPALYESESKAVEEFIAKAYGSTTLLLAQSEIVGRGGVAGYKAGNEVSLQTQVGATAARPLQRHQRPLADR